MCVPRRLHAFHMHHTWTCTASPHSYFVKSRALFCRFLKACTKYPHNVMSRIQRVAEYLMQNILFRLLSVILQTLMSAARHTNKSKNLMMTCFGWKASAESFQVANGRLWRSMDVWANAFLRYSLAFFLSRWRFVKCSAKLWLNFWHNNPYGTCVHGLRNSGCETSDET